MRKTHCLLTLIPLVIFIFITMTAIAEETTLALPSNTQVISEEAFMGNTSIHEIDIPEGTTSIESKAFFGCSALEKVTINSRDVQIADDAFDYCPNANLYVYRYSSGETFAIAQGMRYTLIDGADPAIVSLQEMIGQYSITGTGLQGGANRLIVCTNNNVSLPDISEFRPVAIAQGGSNVYFLQFSDEDNVNDCYAFLDSMRGDEIAVLQRDAVTYVTNRGEDASSVNQSGIMTWEDDDPMGFDDYSKYVSENQSGRQVIAIIDTGIKKSWRDLYASMIYEQNFNVIPDGQNAFYSGREHATYIASIIHDCVGNTNVKIMSVRAVDDNEETLPSIFGDGIRKAVEAGADIINISYVLPYSEYVEYELQEAASKGVKIVIAAGNYNRYTWEYFPANANISSNKFVVSGLEDEDRVWPRTNTGPEVTFCAPAAGIRTSYANIGEGTSFASPMIASALALVELDITHNYDHLIQSCKRDMGLNGKDDRDQAVGYGMPQLDEIIIRLVSDIIVDNVPSVIKNGENINLNYTVLPDNATNKTVTCTSSNNSVLRVSIPIPDDGSWGDWTTDPMDADEFTQVMTQTQYKSITTTYGDWGEWSEWGESRESTSNLKQEDSATVYYWYRYVCPYCGTHMPVYNQCYTWGDGCGKYIGSQYAQTCWLTTPPGNGTQNWNGTGRIMIGNNSKDRWFYWIDGSQGYPNGKSVTGYRYRTRSKNNVSESEWQSTPISPVNTDELTVDVETRTLYRYRRVDGGEYTNKMAIEAVGRGNAIITLSANDESGVTRELDVQVVQPVTSIRVIADTTDLKITETLNLSANVLPSDADNKELTWSSSNESIAAVSSTGVVTPVSGGTVVIRADAQDGYGAYGEFTLNIIPIPDPESIDIIAQNTTLGEDDTLELAPDDKLYLSAVVHPDDAIQTVVWSAKSVPANANVVAIDRETGYLTANNAGSAVVTVTSTEKVGINRQVSILVRVLPDNVTISGPSEVDVGNTIDLTATVKPDSVTNKSVTWSSSNTNVATVSSSGVVTGKKNGDVTIIATSVADSSKVGQKVISVRQKPVSVSVSGTTKIFINNDNYNDPAQTASQLTATISPADTYTGYRSVTWNSSNKSVATVSSTGLVTTVSPGTTTITAISNIDASIKASVTVTVGNKWTSWSSWSTTSVSSTSSKQVLSKTQYSSRERHKNVTQYNDWGAWSEWKESRESTSDLKKEESATVYYWYRYACPSCGTHMHVYNKCYTWANGCGKYIGAQYVQTCWLTTPPGNGTQNWNGTGRIMIGNGPKDRWFYWKDASQGYPNGKSVTGYRYSTRTSYLTWGDFSAWSSWQDQPISKIDNNDYTREVQTRTLYCYRTLNS